MTLASFFLAMIMYPDVQLAAQEELDRTIGRDRLPDMSDQDLLPYTTAILNELWRCVSRVQIIFKSLKITVISSQMAASPSIRSVQRYMVTAYHLT